MTKRMPIDEFRDALARKALSRREVVATLATVGVATVSMPLVSRPALSEDGWLNVFTWSGYDVPELNPGFAGKYGRQPDYTVFADNDEAFEKIRAGYEADIVSPSGSTVIQWIDSGLIQPIDVSRLSHWNDLFPEFQNITGTVDAQGNRYYAPITWGNTSIVFRTDLAPEYAGQENHTWTILWDEKYARRIAFRDNWAGTTIPAGLIAGVEHPFAMTDEEIAMVKELLMQQRDLNLFYWSSESDAQAALASGEIVAMYAWNSAYAQLKAEGVPVEFMIPREGLLTWVDGNVLTNTYVGSEEQRYDYLDATISPEAGAFMIEEYSYGATNMRSYDMVDPALLESLGQTDPQAMLASSLWFETVPPDIRKKLVAVHDEVLIGN